VAPQPPGSRDRSSGPTDSSRQRLLSPVCGFLLSVLSAVCCLLLSPFTPPTWIASFAAQKIRGGSKKARGKIRAPRMFLINFFLRLFPVMRNSHGLINSVISNQPYRVGPYLV